MSKFGFGAKGGSILCSSVSLLALAGIGMSTPAWGQTGSETDTVGAATPSDEANAASAGNEDDIVIVGVRQALANAQDIKRNSDTFVDSITATDIGAFPDKSVAEALQRVPGISVGRLQSTDDSTHPSGEPTNVLIRGLTFVRTEFNGRDSFSADSKRGLNFNDVSPELMAGVDAYKNLTAEMIEGGISGTVNLRTRLPFDAKGQVISGVVKGSYGDRSKDVTFEVSGLYSNVWDTSAGRFGLLVDVAYSHIITRTESIIMDRINTYCSAGAGEIGAGVVNSDGTIPCTAAPFPGADGWRYVPDGVRISQVDYDRTRKGLALAGQYENPAGNLVATVQFTRSEYDNAWLERASHAIFEDNQFGSPAFRPRPTTNLRAAPGSSLVFGADGMLESGIVTRLPGSWSGGSTADYINSGSAVPGLPFVNFCGYNGGTDSCATGVAPREGMVVSNEARNFDHKEWTQDLSFNVKWDASDRLRFSFDAQYIKAETTNDDILVAAATLADFNYSVNGDGTPRIEYLPGTNVNYADGGLANPHNYWVQFIQAHLEDNDAKELAFRGDAEYDIDEGGWLDSLKVGVRHADRNQTVRYSTFNWTPIAAPWNCNGPGFNADNTTPAPYPTDTPNCAGNAGRADFQGYGEGIWESVSLGDSFYGNGAFPNGQLVFLNRDTLKDRERLVESLSGPNTNNPLAPGWSPICDRPNATIGCYTPGEVMDVQEQTTAGYAQLNFGGDGLTIGNGVSVRGNIGVRVVETQIESVGSISFPTEASFLNSIGTQPCGAPLPGNAVVNPRCYLTPELIAFANGGSIPDTFKSSFTNVLPAFNIRFGFGDEHFIRFAASRAMSRPDLGLLRNFVSINNPVIDTGPNSPYVVYNSPNAERIPANVVGYNFVFRAESGYAGLRPILADQFDLGYEWYFGPSSSFTFGLFYKKLKNSIAYGEFDREIPNNGSTQTVQMRGPRNQKGGGTLKGFEVAFQSYFDFLPGLLSGLGAQANYTYVKQSGIRNSNLVTQGALTEGGAAGFGAGNDVNGPVFDSRRLAGISTHTFNLVGLYEKGPIGVRLAYNWRSKYLTNNLDCCIGLPMYQKAAGFLDGSIRFSINQNIELSLEGSNLLNTTSVFQQQIRGDSTATPDARPLLIDSAWSRVDRRFQLGARFKI